MGLLVSLINQNRSFFKAKYPERLFRKLSQYYANYYHLSHQKIDILSAGKHNKCVVEGPRQRIPRFKEAALILCLSVMFE